MSAATAGQPGERNAEALYIILVNWNGREETLACLKSLAPELQSGAKVILVDNASEDGSVEAVRAQFPDVQLILNSENLRFARACNQGMAAAWQQGATHCLLLNNDTEVAPGILSALRARLAADVHAGMAGAKIYFHDAPNMLWYAGGRVRLWKGEISHIGIREDDRGQYDQPSETGYITGCCLLVTRACAEAIGPLDESYYMYGEDADWCMRARAAGFRLYYEPAARVWHKVSASSGGREVAGGLSGFKVRHKLASTLLFLRRHARWYHWFGIPVFAMIAGVRAALLMLAGGNYSGFRAMLTFWRRAADGGRS